MKISVRAALLSVLLTAAGPSVFSQELAKGEQADVAVLLDVSQSMFPWFEQAVDYVVGPLARDYLRFGDGFHILSFSGEVRLEYSTILRTEAEARSALARLYLLYPFGARTDLVAAIEGARDFLATLGTESRKYAILVTDGYHNPDPESPGAGRSPAEVQAAIEAAAAAIRASGWKVVIVRVPFNGGTETGVPATTGSGVPGANASGSSSASGSSLGGSGGAGSASAAASGGSPSGSGSGSAGSGAEALGASPGQSPGAGVYLDQLAESLGASVTDFDGVKGAQGSASTLPTVSWPSELGIGASRFSLPFKVRNNGGEALELRVTSFRLDGVEALARGATLTVAPGAEAAATLKLALPKGMSEGRYAFDAEPGYAGEARASPGRAPLTLLYKPGTLARLIEGSGLGALSPLSLGLIAAALLVALIVLLALRGHPGRRTDARVVDAVLDANASRSAAAARSSRTAPPTMKKAVAAVSLAAQAAPAVSAPGAERVPGLAADDEASATGGPALQDKEAQKTERATAAQADAALLAAYAADSGAEPLPIRKDAKARARGVSSSPRQRGPVVWETRIRKAASLRLELLVRDQNPNIGLRNVHTMSSGSRRSVGGRRSDFLVFLLPVPGRIAELSWDGESLAFVPRRLEFFPDLEGALPDCLDTDIRMLTRRGRELHLRFSRYEPPIDRINRLLHCIDLPGAEEPGLIV